MSLAKDLDWTPFSRSAGYNQLRDLGFNGIKQVREQENVMLNDLQK